LLFFVLSHNDKRANMGVKGEDKKDISFEEFKAEVLADYKVAFESRQASLIGRKEVLTGKAKFGIFGDGKEVAQVAMAKAFKKGDFRSGYYRDQTFMFAKGMSNVQEFFAQLYAHTDVDAEPCSAGRSMNGHFGTRLLDEEGEWVSHIENYNSSADISPTAGQMPRLLGLALASKYYKGNKALKGTNFSVNGNEVAFGTIGNASTSEGPFWEVINAAGVMQVPMAISVWDDGYGISVPSKYQTTKEDISKILAGFQTNEDGKGYDIYRVNGWDYAALCETYAKAIRNCRDNHTPVLIHVREMTQPQGHSTSGSHERYKSKDRLQWEDDWDCIAKMRQWMIEKSIAKEEEIAEAEKESMDYVKKSQKDAWTAYLNPIKEDRDKLVSVLEKITGTESVVAELKGNREPIRKELAKAVHAVLRQTINARTPEREELVSYLDDFSEENVSRYNTYLNSESKDSMNNVEAVGPEFSDNSPMIDGREVLNKFFDIALERDPRVFAFGEDLGKIGDVNQGFAGLQEKHGEERVGDVGIRECSILGQGIGAAMRGLKPIAEIQYLDYLLYAIQIMSDDLATLQYRTKGGQKAPLIVRTRGHRLEGIWHSGSPMGMIINSLRGMNVLVPRNMTQAAGYYNASLKSDEPALIVECLNGYRLKEKLPDNIGDYTLIPGIPEVLKYGEDVTLVTYGSCCRIAEEAIKQLEEAGVNVELIDVQSLLPFDTNHSIVESLKKTNKVVFLDEDVPGGASAFMMQKVLEEQGGYIHLDSEPITITSKEHRPAYGTDGDYFSKPNAEDIFQKIYSLMNEYDPSKYPAYS
jgi:pyruvate/2-oxoglutarate/acetoin dehydrogenase E1 component/TPP-dependent pyruvate/acetoin dehydrogenase alpha subunit